MEKKLEKINPNKGKKKEIIILCCNRSDWGRDAIGSREGVTAGKKFYYDFNDCQLL